mmetsp:Transcript_14719/g.41446  ORF Transcript_14719/g.41446 Transcript_14719/m.41446 type:complete len:192 (+) Transcript_14719:76-651(+)
MIASSRRLSGGADWNGESDSDSETERLLAPGDCPAYRAGAAGRSPAPVLQPTHSVSIGDSEIKAEILKITEDLLNAIICGDFATYSKLCDESLSCFEPEACGGLVEGLQFHKFYFDQPRSSPLPNQTIVSPHVKLLGDQAVVVAYTRLIQSVDRDMKQPVTVSFEETRVWQRKGSSWVNVHFHRSKPTGSG